jgi:hypothetical protein
MVHGRRLDVPLLTDRLELNLQRHVHRAVLGKLAKIQQHLRLWRLLERLNSVRHRPHGGAFRLLCHELAVNPQANRVIDRHVQSISRMDRAERLWLWAEAGIGLPLP